MTQEIEPGAEVDQGDLACLPSGDPRGGVQRDRLPDQIGSFWRHLMLYAELASSLRAIHFKPIVAAVGRD